MNINEISMNIMKTKKSYKTTTTALKHHVKCNENEWKNDSLRSKHFGAPWPMAGQSHLHRLKRYAATYAEGHSRAGLHFQKSDLVRMWAPGRPKYCTLETSTMLEMQGIDLNYNTYCWIILFI